MNGCFRPERAARGHISPRRFVPSVAAFSKWLEDWRLKYPLVNNAAVAWTRVNYTKCSLRVFGCLTACTRAEPAPGNQRFNTKGGSRATKTLDSRLCNDACLSRVNRGSR